MLVGGAVMRRSWKHLWCAHRWSEPQRETYSHYPGPIIGMEQQIWMITVDRRVCKKCALTEEIEISREYFGWV